MGIIKVESSGSPIMKLMGMLQSAKSMTGGEGAAPAPEAQGATQALPADNAAPTDPIQSRIANAQQDPKYLLHQGLQAVNDPNLPLDYETRLAAALPLLEAHHFGPGGKQGNVASGKMDSGNGIGAIASLAALA